MCKQEEKCKECLGDFEHRNDPKKILERLKSGNKRFAPLLEIEIPSIPNEECKCECECKCNSNFMIHPNQSTKRRIDTEKGQKPFAIVLTCADSRVPPELIFDTGIGDLFVVRVAGNIANTSSIASIEYAVKYLECKFILVLGHENCGAVEAAIDAANQDFNSIPIITPPPKYYSDNLSHLIGHILPAVKACKCKSKGDLKNITKKNVLHSISELNRCSTIIRNANVKFCPAYYNLKTGVVDFDFESKCE